MTDRRTLVCPALALVLSACAVETDADVSTSDDALGPSNAYCPAGATFDAQYRMCTAGDDALGPFPSRMTDACVNSGGGKETCAGNRWNAAFARGLRGKGTCAPGATLDAARNACVEGNEAYGPFTRDQVARCKQAGGGGACETMRWAKSLLPARGGGGSRSERLVRSDHGLFNPIPGGQMCGYAADTGLDVCASYVPVYAVAAGTLDYSTWGHTSWQGPRDTAYSVRVKLDTPFTVKGRRITHVYYTHLKSVAISVPDGATHHPHVEAGQLLGVSGIANDVPHLHLGLIVDGRVGQRSDSDILKEWDVRLALGEYAAGERLPSR